MADGTDLFDIIHTTRSMRRLKADPVPDALIRRILEAGQCAPSGGNAQRWRFLVIKDPAIKKAVQVWYKRAFDEVIGPRYRSSAPPPGVDAERYRRAANATEYLTEHFHEAPVWIVACLEHGSDRPNRGSGSSIYPAVQNIILACRALGLGTLITTNHILYEDEVRAILGLPDDVFTFALMPIGFPHGKYGPLTRRPVSEVAFADRWGANWPG
jgi:nitroreductase